jgi:release factor glutamine methyltransferase
MPTEQTWTILELIKATTTYFESHEVAPARLTAEILLAHALKLRRLDLYMRTDQPCSTKEREAFRELVKRRSKGEPAQYIVGQAEFWSLSFKVDARVLVPRADTEVLVEEAVSFLKARHPKGEGLRVLDLCTGSGCVAIALRKELPGLVIVAVEKDPGALEVAKLNIEQLKQPVELLLGDLYEPVSGQAFDLIVSNPPYIPTADIAGLSREVSLFEPKLALDGGRDGLDVARRIYADAKKYLTPNGACLIEIDPDQGSEAKQIATLAGFTVKLRRDYESRERVVVATLGVGASLPELSLDLVEEPEESVRD